MKIDRQQADKMIEAVKSIHERDGQVRMDTVRLEDLEAIEGIHDGLTFNSFPTANLCREAAKTRFLMWMGEEEVQKEMALQVIRDDPGMEAVVRAVFIYCDSANYSLSRRLLSLMKEIKREQVE